MENPNLLFGEAQQDLWIENRFRYEKENQNIYLDSDDDIWILRLLCAGGQNCCSNQECSLLIPTPSIGKDDERFKLNGYALDLRVSECID